MHDHKSNLLYTMIIITVRLKNILQCVEQHPTNGRMNNLHFFILNNLAISNGQNKQDIMHINKSSYTNLPTTIERRQILPRVLQTNMFAFLAFMVIYV